VAEQSVIVCKLNSHRRQNRTKRALWEFEHIIRSLYLLDYVDSPLLRRNVHRALNRGESYHQLRRAIAYCFNHYCIKSAVWVNLTILTGTQKQDACLLNRFTPKDLAHTWIQPADFF
jgi:hypothetical protein